MPSFLDEICAHIPDPQKKAAISYGWYSNRTRGFRKAHCLLPPAPPSQPVPEADRAPPTVRWSWVRLIRKTDETDPLRCLGCGATMPVIAIMDQEELLYRILAPLNLLVPGDGPRAPPGCGLSGPLSPARVEPTELIYAPVFDDLPGPESA